MGLPIWRDPDESRRKKTSATSAIKQDATALGRSPIRRRPSVHGRQYPRLTRQHSVRDPSRSNLPYQPGSWAARSVNDISEAARDQLRGVPPISVLLESADRQGTELQAAGATSEDRSRSSGSDATFIERAFARSQDMAARRHPLRTDDDNQSPRPARPPHRGRGAFYPLRRPVDTNVRPNRSPAYLALPQDGRTRFFRSPEPLIDLEAPSRPRLPTPPLERSSTRDSSNSLFIPESAEARLPPNRRHHPLSNSWRPDSPINGLGDRTRSPSTAGDNWEIMRSTIEPDMHLPSADSSFTSAAASNSFSSNDGTHITVPSNDGESPISVDANDLVCADDDVDNAMEGFAEDVFYHESSYPEGRERIEQHRRRRGNEGNRFARSNETERVDIGFRLIEEAIDTEDGRQRLSNVRADISFDDAASITRARRSGSQAYSRPARRTRRRAGNLMDIDVPSTAIRPLSPQASHTYDRSRESTLFSDDTGPAESTRHLPAARVLSEMRDGAQWQFTAHHSALGQNFRQQLPDRPETPSLETIAAQADPSSEAPQPYPVSPPTARSELEMTDSLLSSGNESSEDLDSVRRIIERLAQRDDIPEEWWMGMGLNLSRTAQSISRHRPRAVDVDEHLAEAYRAGRERRADGRSARRPRL